jgi:phage minor structural protein
MSRLRAYSPQRRPLGILQNAFDMSESVRKDAISTFSFSLPEGDAKNALCAPFNTVQFEEGQLYRIVTSTRNSDEQGFITYECEHVIATLLDSIMFGWHVMGGAGVANNTSAVIRWLLQRQNMRFDPWTGVWTTDTQKVTSWRLGVCDINRNFEYGWEQETLLKALWSIPNPFTEDFMWTYNTDAFPYTVNLTRLTPDRRTAIPVMWRSNLVKLTHQSDPTTVCTRIYPLGYGEGINQLNIRSVNNNVPFVQSPVSIVNQRGIIERPFIDRRYTNPLSLRDAALALLNALQNPYEEYSLDMAILTDDARFLPRVGQQVHLIDEDVLTWIIGVEYKHDEDRIVNVQLANQSRDIASSIANAKDRQRIEMAYAQGASTFFTESENGNCDPQNPLLLTLFIPPGLNIVNFIELNIVMERFRIDTQATDGGGARTQSSGASNRRTVGDGGRRIWSSRDGGSRAITSRDGGSRAITSRDGGGQAISSQAGGQESIASASGGGEIRATEFAASLVDSVTTQVFDTTGTSSRTFVQGGGGISSLNFSVRDPGHGHTASVSTESGLGGTDFATTGIEVSGSGSVNVGVDISHTHNIHLIFAVTTRLPAHDHRINLPSHTHNVLLPNHSHNINLPLHSHSIDLPLHSHSIDLPDHSHTIELPDHTHDMTHDHTVVIPSHTHTMTPRMVTWGVAPTQFTIRINGTNRQTTTATRLNRDITQWLLDAQGRLPRGTYHRIDVIPNAPAHIRLMASVKGFINSRGDRAL